MVSIITLPSGTYFCFYEILIGPFGSDGRPVVNPGGVQTFPVGQINQSRGTIIGDRDCLHDKISGKLYLDTPSDRMCTIAECQQQFGGKSFRELTATSGEKVHYYERAVYERDVEWRVYRDVDEAQKSGFVAHARCFGFHSNYCFVGFTPLVFTGKPGTYRRELYDLTETFWKQKTTYPIEWNLKVFVPNDPNNWFAGITVYNLSEDPNEYGYITPDIGDNWGKMSQLVRKYFDRPEKSGLKFWSYFPPVQQSMLTRVDNLVSERLTNDELRQLVRTLYKLVPSPLMTVRPKDVWGKLAKRVISNSETVDINTIAFLKDFTKIRDMMPPLPKGGAAGLVKPKYLSKLYLWWNYGACNTYRDILSLVKSLHKTERTRGTAELLYNTARGSLTYADINPLGPCVQEYHGKLRYSRYPQAFMKLRTHLDSLGLYPDLEKSWDMVPFSFVVDWLYPISDLLSNCDVYTDVQYFDIWAYTKSEKVTQHATLPGIVLHGLRFSGTLQRTIYDRIVSRTIDLPQILPDDPSVEVPRHWAEAATLAIALKK